MGLRAARHRGGVIRLIALTPLALAAVLPASASAHEGHLHTTKAMERSALGLEHAAEHFLPKQRRRAEPDGGPTAPNAVAGGDPAEVGRWSGDYFTLPNYAIHAVMLPTGKVLFWGYPPEPIEGGQRANSGEAALWDPKLGTGPESMKEVDPPLVDPDGAGPLDEVRAPLYCSGQTLLPSGAVLAAGGNLIWPGADPDDGYGDYAGADIVYTFDPYAETWVAQARMSGGRWYPSQVRLADGRTAILGGFDENAPGGSYADTVEIFTPANEPEGLGQISAAGGGPQFLSALYPHLTTMPNGRVLMSGPAEGDYALLDFPAGRAASITDLPPTPDGVNRIGGNAVPRPAGPKGTWQVTQLGGIEDTAPANPGAPPDQLRYDAMATSVTTDGKSGQTRVDAALPSGRAYANAVLLPDRSIVQIGGGNGRNPIEGNYDAVEADKRVQVLDPETNTWTLGPSQREFRTYHSVAVLLPDGRVFSAGDDYHSVEAIAESPGYYRSSRTDTAEIYEPAYLFAKGERPKIKRAPKRVGYDTDFSVTIRGGKATEAVLMAPGATTHGADMGQAMVPLKQRPAPVGGKRKKGTRVLRFRTPANPKVATPGPYMLFAMSRTGKPSVARWVFLR